MCSHYQAAKKADLMERYFGVFQVPELPTDMWPKYKGAFVRRPPEWDAGDEAVPEREIVTGRWGLVSALTRSDNLAKAEKLSTFNARSETAGKSFTYGNAWKKAQRCIIPAEAIFEPDWRSGKAVATRFTRTDGAPMGVAGLWDEYRNAAGELVASYTMLTINADEHELFRDFHKPTDEKRMVVILPEGSYQDWLTSKADETREFLNQYPADLLLAEPVTKKDPSLF